MATEEKSSAKRPLLHESQEVHRYHKIPLVSRQYIDQNEMMTDDSTIEKMINPNSDDKGIECNTIDTGLLCTLYDYFAYK